MSNIKLSAHGGYKEHKKKPWIIAFRHLGTILKACEAVRVERSTVRNWRKNDPDFEAAFVQCDTEITEMIEDKMFERAMAGDTALLIFLAKCRNPRKYIERYHLEVSHRQIEELTALVVNLLKQKMPEFCPGCKTHLNFKADLAEKLIELSKNLAVVNLREGIRP